MQNKFVNAAKNNTKCSARKGACVTRIEEVDDGVREESMEQRKEEEEESSEKQRPRASKILHQRVNKKEFNTKLRIFRFAVGIPGRGRGEDCRTSIEEERQVPEIHLDYMFMGHQKEGQHLVFFWWQENEGQSCAQHRGPEGVDGRVDLPTAHGMSA